ncbi:15498_t:CDS:1, partial [Cetraspora pellucida]
MFNHSTKNLTRADKSKLQKEVNTNNQNAFDNLVLANLINNIVEHASKQSHISLFINTSESELQANSDPRLQELGYESD